MTDKNKNGKVCLGVKVTDEMHSRLVEFSKEKEMSISTIVRMAIREYLQKGVV